MCSRVFAEDKLGALSSKRGEFILEATGALSKAETNEGSSMDAGSMAAVSASAEQVLEVLQGSSELQDLVLANLNAPKQNVISGPSSQIDLAIQKFKDQKLRAKKIPVACAFHSKLVASAAERFEEYIGENHSLTAQYSIGTSSIICLVKPICTSL